MGTRTTFMVIRMEIGHFPMEILRVYSIIWTDLPQQALEFTYFMEAFTK